MPDFTIRLAGEPIRVSLGESATEAARQAGLARDAVTDAQEVVADAIQARADIIDLNSISREDGLAPVAGNAIGNGVFDTYLMRHSPFDADGVLDSISLTVTDEGASNVKFKLVEPSADWSTASLVAELAAQPLVAGLNTVEMGGVEVKRGQVVGIARETFTSSRWQSFSAASGTNLGAVASGDLTGTNVGLTSGTLVPLISFQWRRTIGAEEEAATLHGLEAGIGSEMTGRSLTFGQAVLAGSVGTGGQNATVYFPAEAIGQSGPVKELRPDLNSVTRALIVHWRPYVIGGTTGSVQRTFFIEPANTTNPLIAGVDFDEFQVQRGDRIGICKLSSTTSLRFTTNTRGGAYKLTMPVPLGSSAPLEAITVNIGLGVTIAAPPVSLLEFADTQGDRLRESVTAEFQTFTGTATPAAWSLTGWTVNNGLVSPAAEGFTQIAQYTDDKLVSTRHTTRMRFSVTRATPTLKVGFGIGVLSTWKETGPVIVNCEVGALQIYDNTNTLRVTSAPFGFANAPGAAPGEYTLEVKRKRHTLYIVFSDLDTGESFKWKVGGTSSQCTSLKGPLKVTFLDGSGTAGDVIVRWVNVDLDGPPDPFAVVLGDSNTEGIQLPNGFPPSWAERLDDIRNRGDIINFSVGGWKATDAQTALANGLLDGISPRYVVIALGTNDTALGTWRTAIQAIVSAAVAAGATPVLCTIPPRTDGGTIGPDLLAANNDIRTGYFGRWPYIDFMQALAAGRDETTNAWNTAFLLVGDILHYNDLGNDALIRQDPTTRAITGQIARDAPFLLSGVAR